MIVVPSEPESSYSTRKNVRQDQTIVYHNNLKIVFLPAKWGIWALMVYLAWLLWFRRRVSFSLADFYADTNFLHLDMRRIHVNNSIVRNKR